MTTKLARWMEPSVARLKSQQATNRLSARRLVASGLLTGRAMDDGSVLAGEWIAEMAVR